MRRYYLDHNASSPLRASVADRIVADLRRIKGNASSVHAEGQGARATIERARRIVHRLMGAGRATFVSGATEANNTVLRAGIALGPLVTSRLEHPSVVQVAEALEGAGHEVRWVSHDPDGDWHLDHLAELVRGAGLVALMAANNETGRMNPIGAVSQICRAHGVPLHVDATQIIGRLPWDPELGASSVTFSAHKSGGPQGVGVLWTARGTPPPLIIGGAQERGARAGTENTLLIAAMGAHLEAPDYEGWAACAVVRDALEAALVARGAVVNAPGPRLPNTLNVAFDGRSGEAMVMGLDMEGVAVSTGSACTAGTLEPSKVLTAMGLDERRVRGSIRLSIGPELALADLDELLARFDRVLART